MFDEITQDTSIENYLIRSDKPRKPIQPIFYVDKKPIGTRGNIVCISGPPKTCKTFIVSSITSSFVCGEWANGKFTAKKSKVVWFDTEQDEGDVGNVYDRVSDLSGVKDGFKMYSLVGMDPQEIIKFIDMVFLQDDFDVFIVDSVLDLIESMNDEKEAKQLVRKFQNMIKEKNCLMICVIHSNYESSKLLGHFGSFLEKKGECSFYIQKSENMFRVQCKNCRREPFDSFNVLIKDGKLRLQEEIEIFQELTPSKEVFVNFYEKDDEPAPF